MMVWLQVLALVPMATGVVVLLSALRNRDVFRNH